MSGIKETKDVIVFACKLTKAIEQALKDGKVTIMDATNFIAPLMSLGSALQGVDQVLIEINDLTAEEKIELVEAVATDLKLESAKVNEIVEQSLSSALDFFLAYKKISTLLKKEDVAV